MQKTKQISYAHISIINASTKKTKHLKTNYKLSKQHALHPSPLGSMIKNHK